MKNNLWNKKTNKIMKRKLFLAFLVLLGLVSVNERVLGQTPERPSFDLLPTPATEADLQAGGDFYVLNVGSAKFLTRTLEDNNWGTRSCVADYMSMERLAYSDDQYRFTIAYSADNGYTFYSYGINKDRGPKNGYLFAGTSNNDYPNVWTDSKDSGGSCQWNIASTTNEAFSIKNRMFYINPNEAHLFFAPNATSQYALCYTNTNSNTHANFIDWKFYKASECTDYLNAVKAYEQEVYEKPRLTLALTKAEKLLDEETDATLAAVVQTAQGIIASNTTSEFRTQTNIVYAAITAYLSNLTSIYPGATEMTINNPTVATNHSGWTVAPNGSAGGSGTLAEFYDKDYATFSQVIANCTPGRYKLVAQGFFRIGANNQASKNAWITDAVTASLYATTVASDITLSTPLASIYSIPSNTALTGQKYGFADGVAGAKVQFTNGYYPVELDFTMVVPGDVAIGINSGPTAGSRWLCFNNFKLVRLGDLPPSNATQDDLDAIALKCTQAKGLIDNAVMQGVLKIALQEKYEAANAISLQSTLEAATLALNELVTAITNGETSKNQYAALQTALANSNANKANYQSYPGYADFLAVIAEAQEIYNGATVDYPANVTAGLKEAERNCRFTQSTPADFTWTIANPGFEGNAKEGWLGNVLASQNDNNDLRGKPRPYVHFTNQFMEEWVDNSRNYTLPNRDAYQAITGLPEGWYLLSAAVNATWQSDPLRIITGVSLYANEESVSCYTGNGFPEIYRVPVYVDAGDLRLGLKIVSTNANWVAMDNFRLEYHGVNATQALLDDLKSLTDQAATFTTDDISPAADALRAESAKHLAYVVDVTDAGVVLGAVESMRNAIETYRSAYIKNYSFEAYQDPFTVGVSPDVKDWTRSTTDGYAWSGCNADWQTNGDRSFGIFKNAIDSDFELSQTLTTVPNGTYLVTVDMALSKNGATSRVNGQRLFAGAIESYFPADKEADTEAQMLTKYHTLSVVTVVTDGTLKLGARTNGGTKDGIGWFKVDNFTIKQLSDNTILELVDNVDFNSVASPNTNVSYTRNFSAENVNGESLHGWQTISLPFDATVTYGGNELEANEDYWLFEATAGSYVAADAIEANKLYLIAMPNDDEVYIPEMNVEGDVLFTGTSLAATAKTTVGVHASYNLVADYKAVNTGYGIDDFEDKGIKISGFVNDICRGAFWPYAVSTGNTAAPARFGIGGDNYGTGLRKVSNLANVPLLVVNVDGGIEITTEKSQFVRIHALGGKLVKSIRVPEGTSRITLPVGMYLVNGVKVSVNF